MTVVLALAAVFTAAGAASAQALAPRIPLTAPRASLPALTAAFLSAPAVSGAPLAPSPLGTRVLGVPGPGVTPEHIAAVAALAERSGLPIVVHGSRQTGVSPAAAAQGRARSQQGRTQVSRSARPRLAPDFL